MYQIDELWEKLQNGEPFFIAEAGVNHLGSLELGERLIKEAAEAGAHAIKFQSYKAKDLCTKDAPRFWDWDGELEEEGSQFDSYTHLDSFGEEEHLQLRKLCNKYNIEFMSTPFDDEATHYLDRVGINAYKIASCDVTNHPLLKTVASKNKIVMLSTGASNLEEIRSAVDVLESNGTDKIVIMHCNLKYPTEPQDINLRMIDSIRECFGNKYVYGLSDHTLNIETPSFAIMKGANVVEKHYTVDKTLDKSADHWLSVDPPQVKQIVRLMKLSYTMLGSHGSKKSTPSEERAKMYARRSIVSTKEIKKGDIFTEENIGYKRPGTGISPSLSQTVLGKTAAHNIRTDTILNPEDIK